MKEKNDREGKGIRREKHEGGKEKMNERKEERHEGRKGRQVTLRA